jgi:hypothetical protein
MKPIRLAEITVIVAVLLAVATQTWAAAPLSAWAELSATPLPVPLAQMATFTHIGYVYILGGKTSFPYGDVAEVYRAEMFPDGTLGTWEELASLPEARTSGAAAVVGDYVFYTGGAHGGDTQDEAFRSRLRSDGTLETWMEVGGAALPDSIYGHKIVAVDNCLLLIGGFATPIGDQAYMVDHVYRAQVDPLTGDLPFGWQDLGVSHSLPKGVYNHTTVVANDYVYVIGGYSHQLTPAVQDSVYRARLIRGVDCPELGPWEALAEARLPIRLYAFDGAFTEGSIFITGGSSGNWVGGAQNKVYRSVVDPVSGNLAPWEELPEAVLPERLISHRVVGAGRYLFNLGGTTRLAEMTDKVYVARVVEAIPEAKFVPEPGSVLLLASGLVGLAGYASLRWRKRR